MTAPSAVARARYLCHEVGESVRAVGVATRRRCPACAPGLRCLACDMAAGLPFRAAVVAAEEDEREEAAEAAMRRRGGDTHRRGAWDRAGMDRTRPAGA